jgi:hypothetical protein
MRGYLSRRGQYGTNGSFHPPGKNIHAGSHVLIILGTGTPADRYFGIGKSRMWSGQSELKADREPLRALQGLHTARLADSVKKYISFTECETFPAHFDFHFACQNKPNGINIGRRVKRGCEKSVTGSQATMRTPERLYNDRG